MTENEQSQREKRLEELRRAIQQGLASGEPTPWNPEEIKQEGRKRRAARHGRAFSPGRLTPLIEAPSWN